MAITYKDAGVDNLNALVATLLRPYYQIGRTIPGEPRVTYRT